MQYYFILGKNPILSKAEIEAVLRNLEVGIMNSELFGKVFFVETEKEMDINWLNSRLGGTVKIGRVLGKIKKLAEFETKFFKHIKYGDGKVYFGFSLYDLSPIHLIKYQKQLTPMAMEIKRRLREEKNINSRYVVSRETELSSVIVAKNKLLQNGAEICFFIDEQGITFGQTLAVQQFEEFGARDFTRPGRDDVSGMLPPKLARMMINLAQINEEAVILDPFCGSGTVLQEAIILGHKNLFGTDNSSKAVEDAKNNLDWLKNKYEVKGLRCSVVELDVRELDKKFEANAISAIITEPYLGPALRGFENSAQIDEIANKLSQLYLLAFQQFAKILKPGGKVVIIFPYFHLPQFTKKIKLVNEIETFGFKYLNQQDLIYSRPNQLVWRDLQIFEKN